MKEFLARFTPSLMSPETLEGIFVQREKLAQSLVERIRDSALTPARHHMLLIGPRGMGKTHLVALVYHRIKALDDVRDRLRIAWMREEEWGITSFLDLLLRILRALNEEHADPQLAERTEALYELPSDEAERAAADLLRCYVGDRTLLILIENLGDIFKGLGNEGQQQLRAFLQNHALATILATAQSLFNGISRHTSPFYGFFNIHHLQELDLNDATCLLTKIAEHEKDEDLAAFLQTPKGRARVRAVHHLAGGNPRVYLIFSQFLTRESLDGLVDPFMQMLDDLTPYYQARMAWLSPLQRKIVEFLIENRGAAPVKAIAQRVFKSHQTISGQLKALRENGYVQSKSAGRESFYELREPLMRLAIEVKKHRDKPIRLFLDFLRLWYTRSELEERLGLLRPEAVLEREYILHTLALMGENTEDPRVEACRKDFFSYFETGDFERALQVAEELVEVRGGAVDWELRGAVLGSMGRYKDALAVFEKAITLQPDQANSWQGRGGALHGLGRYEEALASFEKAVTLHPNNATIWYHRGLALGRLGRHEEALSSYDRSLELNPEDAAPWSNRGAALGSLGRHGEALLSIEKAIEIQPDYGEAWYNRGRVLFSIGRYEEVLASFEKVVSYSEQPLEFFVSGIKTVGANAEAVKKWVEVWEKLAGERDEFQQPLHILRTLIRYRETEDQRVLLELPAEERRILEEVLGLEEAAEA